MGAPRPRFEEFDGDLQHAIAIAQEFAQSLNHNYIGSEHLLAGICSAHGVAPLMEARGLAAADVRQAVEEIVGWGDRPHDMPGLAPRARLAIARAAEIAPIADSVRPRHLLAAIAELDDEAVSSRILHGAGVDRALLRRDALAGPA
jgi:ATP-dependent Clp protease ATP-binding subunit ClpC